MYTTVGAVIGTILLLRFLWKRWLVAPVKDVKGGYKPDITIPHDETVELYYADISSMSMKVRFCLAAAEVKFKPNLVQLPAAGSFETKKASYLRINPMGTVPVLIHNGHPVHDSCEQLLYIAEQLDQTPGKTLMPKDTNDRLICKYWLKQTAMNPNELQDNMEAGLKRRSGNLIPMLSLPILPVIASKLSWLSVVQSFLVQGFAAKQVLIFLFATMGVHTFKFLPFLTKVVKMAKKNLLAHLAELEDFLKSKRTKFIHGDDISIADISWAPILERLHFAGWWEHVDDEMYSHVKKYWENMRALPAYQEAIRPVGIDAAFLDEIRDSVKTWKSKYPWYKSLFQ